MASNNFSRGSVAIAVCDRCKMRVSYLSLRADGNSPGLRVCAECWDIKDPWRLPRPKEKPINLRYPRPDLELTVPTPDTIPDEMGPPSRPGPSQ